MRACREVIQCSSLISCKSLTVLLPPCLPCVSFQSRCNAVSGRHRHTWLIRGLSSPSRQSAMYRPITDICMNPWPEPPTANVRFEWSGWGEIRYERSGVSAHQQIRARLNGLSTRCGIVSRRNALTAYCEALGMAWRENGTQQTLPVFGSVVQLQYPGCSSQTLSSRLSSSGSMKNPRSTLNKTGKLR